MNNSYVSASAFPVKVIVNGKIMENVLDYGKIIPYHIQINPTNVCQLKCSFCSTKNRDKKLSVNINKLKSIIDKFIKLGTRAVTITGGGEPLCYKHMEELVNYCYFNNLKIGLVTNGIALGKVATKEFFNKITWCRISCSSEFICDLNMLHDVVNNANTDWAFSYVITDISIEKIILGLKKCIQFANDHKFTHVRIVNDLLNSDNGFDLTAIAIKIKQEGIDDSKVIYQGRKDYTHGLKECYISLLKPNIGPDGNVYGCCGLMYSDKIPLLDLPKKYSMGSDINKIWWTQKHYDGSKCSRCYYGEYNELFKSILDKDLSHKEFI